MNTTPERESNSSPKHVPRFKIEILWLLWQPGDHHCWTFCVRSPKTLCDGHSRLGAAYPDHASRHAIHGRRKRVSCERRILSWNGSGAKQNKPVSWDFLQKFFSDRWTWIPCLLPNKSTSSLQSKLESPGLIWYLVSFCPSRLHPHPTWSGTFSYKSNEDWYAANFLVVFWRYPL